MAICVMCGFLDKFDVRVIPSCFNVSHGVIMEPSKEIINTNNIYNNNNIKHIMPALAPNTSGIGERQRPTGLPVLINMDGWIALGGYHHACYARFTNKTNIDHARKHKERFYKTLPRFFFSRLCDIRCSMNSVVGKA